MPDPWSDLDMILLLDLVDGEGMSVRRAAEEIGRSRNACLGMMHRIRNETACSDPDGNQNGTMPRRWWA